MHACKQYRILVNRLATDRCIAAIAAFRYSAVSVRTFKSTAAMEAELTDHVCDIEELIGLF
jgi:hypothetical protein